MPLNSGPGIGGKPGGGGSSSFGLPGSRPGGMGGSTTKTKWVIAEAGSNNNSSSSSPAIGSIGGGLIGGGGGGSPAPRGPVTGSCIDILSDPFAWIVALGASATVAFLTQDTAEVSSAASKWMYIGAAFAGYVCAIFVIGFAVAAFLWAGTKSKAAMQVGFMLVAGFIAVAPLALSRIRNPKSADAAPTVAVAAPTEQPVEAPQPIAEQPPIVVEQPAAKPAEPEPDPAPAPAPQTSPAKPEISRPGTLYAPTEPGLRPRASITPVRKPAPNAPAKSTPKPSMSADLKLMLSEMRNLLSDIKGDAAELQEKLKEEGLDSLLAPTSFTSRTRIDDARRRIASIKRIADSYERTVLARFDTFPDRIRELEISEDLKQAAVKAFETSRPESLKKLREIAQLDRAILSEADKLFAFMDTRLGRFRVGDRIVFQNSEDAETYNRYVERLQELAAREERVVIENQKAALRSLAAMEREITAADR